MSRSAPGAPFTVRKAGAVLGLARTVVAKLAAAGFVSPSRGPDGDQRFTFQDLRLMRTAHALQQAGVSPRKIMRSLTQIKAGLPPEESLASLRITAVGADVAVRDRRGHWHAESGQRLLDFDPVLEPATVVDIVPPSPSGGGSGWGLADGGPGGGQPPTQPSPGGGGSPHTERADDVAQGWFDQGVALEGVDDAAAEDAYRRAVALDPGHFNAWLNLGARLSESDRHGDALALYDDMLEKSPDASLLHFNRAVVLENLGRRRDALAAYDRALELDSTFADAHYNAGQLSQELGDPRGALRHFSACRRLGRDDAR